MTDVLIILRSPFAPHTELARLQPVRDSLEYGFTLLEPARAAFSISRNDPALLDNPSALTVGVMVTIERGDQILPWAGWLSQPRLRLSLPIIGCQAVDHAGRLYEDGHTALAWREQERASGHIIRDVFAEAEGRRDPPLLTDLAGLEGGPTTAYSSRGESLLAFLQTLAQAAGWEWGLEHQVGKSVRTRLLWRQRIGRDRRAEVIFQEGETGAFEDAELTQDAEGFISNGLAIGGSGPLRSRPAVQANARGRGDPGIDGVGIAMRVPSSPALAGTRVFSSSLVSNKDALAAAARRLHRAPEYVRERFELDLVESRIDMKTIELGSTYRVRFASSYLGIGLERIVRCLALGLGTNGVVQMITETED